MENAHWQLGADGTPRSVRFDDVYFSVEGGLDEARYIFIEQNRLGQRFAQMAENATFIVAETGFGTGLNFLTTWQYFEKQAPQSARLCFISTEKYPLSVQDIRQSLACWPQLAEQVEQLLRHYPPAVTGYHCLELSPRVELWLLLGDAIDSLSELTGKVDAWFLDGFTPSRNPDMWQPALFTTMQRLSGPGTTVATFTSARTVYDGLTGAGFRVKRIKGFGHKRNMLAAEFIGLEGPPEPGLWPANEWAWPRPTGPKRALVVGAGLAGAHTARELAERGWQVTVFEQQPGLAQGASGNPQGALYARLSHQSSASNRFYQSALMLAQRRLRDLPASLPHQQCGLLQLNQGNKETKRFAGFRSEQPYPTELVEWVDAAKASELAGVPLDSDALYFADGGWISPADLVAERLNHPSIDLLTDHKVTHLAYHQGHWQISYETAGASGTLNTSQVILATAWQLPEITQAAHLPIRPIAGQISQIASEGLLAKLKTVICSDRYLVPSHEGKHCLGATFHLNKADAKCQAADDIENLQQLHARLPGIIKADAQAVGSRASTRAASPDYLPMVGPLIEPEAFTRLYGKALQKRLTQRLAPPPWLPSLWINTAHGSKGLCSVPLTAKLLACWINGEPLPLEQSLVNHLNPNRFLIRSLIRAKRSID